MEERKDADAPAPKKTAMEIHAAWQAECQRATAAYDQTKHQYIERFQKFAQALWAAKKTEDAETGYEHLPPRGRVSALLRKTSALADDAALPGRPVAGADDIMMRATGGGKVVAGLITGEHAPQVVRSTCSPASDKSL